jgi:hypothetical protein
VGGGSVGCGWSVCGFFFFFLLVAFCLHPCYTSCCWVGFVFVSVAFSSSLSFASSVAPPACLVWRLASSFPGLGVVSVRRSRRSFSGWVCVCSFGSRSVAVAFASRAASQFLGFGCFCLVRRSPRGRWRVSVPCCRPGSALLALRPRFVRFGRFRVRFPGSSSAAAAAVASLRSPLAGVLAGVRSVGFSGSRAPSPAAVSALRSVLPCLRSAGVRLSVGCAPGVDQLVRGAFGGSPSLLVFCASSPRFGGGGGVRAALARRSAACVRSVSRGRRGLLLVLPSGACPAGVRPGRSFRGCGSGSWGSAALAVCLGRRVVVWLPSGLQPPAWSGFSWSFVGGGWWLCVPAPRPCQLSLF